MASQLHDIVELNGHCEEAMDLDMWSSDHDL